MQLVIDITVCDPQKTQQNCHFFKHEEVLYVYIYCTRPIYSAEKNELFVDWPWECNPVPGEPGALTDLKDQV